MKRSQVRNVIACALVVSITCVSARAQTIPFESGLKLSANQVARFYASHDVSQLWSADSVLLQSAAITGDGATNLVRRRAVVRGWLTIFKAIDANIDPTFNDKDIRQLPGVSLTPPRENSGVRLPSGADPQDIKDPIARATYQAELRENARRARRVTLQAGLRNLDDSSIDSLRIALSNFRPFTPNDSVTLIQMVRSSGLSQQRISKILPLI